MARLPAPGEDDGTWGTILNDFLVVEHNPDGTLKNPSPDPAGSVVNEVVYGQSPVIGTSSEYARADHTHGTPSLSDAAPSTAQGIGTTGSAGTALAPARADHTHPMAAAGAPSASAVGDVQSTGSATTFAASDHVHTRESFGSVTALTSFNVAASDGVSTTVARADHTHGAPALATFVTPSADQATTSVTVENINGLGLSVGIGSYEFDFLIPYTGSVSNGSGLLLDLDGPTHSFLSYNLEIQFSNTNNAIYYRSVFASNQAAPVIVTAGNIYTAKIRGRVITTANGILQPRFGANTGGTTTTAKQGMYGKLVAH